MFFKDCSLSEELTLQLGKDFCELLIPSINIIIAFAERIMIFNGGGDYTNTDDDKLYTHDTSWGRYKIYKKESRVNFLKQLM